MKDNLSYKETTEEMQLDEDVRAVYDQIMQILYSYTGVDFSSYKESTVMRRIERRIMMNHTEMNDYLDMLVASDEEKEKLFEALLIEVTEFFRDREAFAALSQTALSALFNSEEELRVWSVACATGKEAYSLAILLQEYKEHHNIDKEYKVFATDINKSSVLKAQSGMYEESEMEGMPEELLGKYFEKTGNSYRIKDSIRKNIVFAVHNVLKDAPFSKLHLISCRNFFIYLKSDIQKNVLLLFYKALRDEGYLFLGSSETTDGKNEIFQTVDTKYRIYRKDVRCKEIVNQQYRQTTESACYVTRPQRRPQAERLDIQELYEKVLMVALRPAVLINEQGEIIRILKDANCYLHMQEGQFEKTIESCMAPSCAVIVWNMIRHMSKENIQVLQRRADNLPEYENQTLTIRIDGLLLDGLRNYLVQFDLEAQQESLQEASQQVDSSKLKDYRIQELESALAESNQRLQCAIEELEIKNEELQSSNEEMIVSNEELRSTNEELQLVNEELQRVNGGYQDKIEELERTNSDFDNLLLNAEVGALYIDQNMRIRKITPIIEMTTNLIASDVGRPISHISFMKEYPDFASDIEKALRLERMVEKEICDAHGIIWLIRIRPNYGTTGGVSGLLITMFDVTKRLEAAKFELKVLMDNVPGGVARMRYDHGLIIEYANSGLYQIMQCTKEQFLRENGNYYDSIILPEDWKQMQKEIECCMGNWTKLDMEYRVRNQEGKIGWQMITAAPIQQDGKVMLQCTISDITRIKETERQLDSLVENFPGGILRIFYNGDYPHTEYVSEGVVEITGIDLETYQQLEKENKEIDLFGEDEWSIGKAAMDKAFYEGKGSRCEYLIHRLDKEVRWAEFRSSVVSRSESGVLIQYVVLDITEQKQIEESLKRERERVDIVAGLSTDAIFEYEIAKDQMHYYSKKQDFLASRYGKPIVEHYTEQILHGNQAEKMVYPDDYDKLIQLCWQLRAGAKNIYFELRSQYAPGKFCWIAVEAKAIEDENNKASFVIGKISNIDERKQREEQLKEQSERDPLTALYNSRVVKSMIDECRRKEEKRKAILLIADIDNFKAVNDKMGHLYGDAVICTFADALRSSFPDALIGRIGGDEFLVYVENVEVFEIEGRIKELTQKLSRIYVEGENNTKISASFGMVNCKEEQSLEKLIKMADSALYFMKNHTKGGMIEYREGMLMGDSAIGAEETNNYVPEALIHTENDLIVFALELFERVKDTKGAIRVLADSICRFYSFSDILYFQMAEDGMVKMIFHWGEADIQQFYDKPMDVSGEDWEALFFPLEQKTSVVLLERDIKGENVRKAKSILSIGMVGQEEKGYMLFIDKQQERTWQTEEAVLERLANIIFKRLMDMKQKENQKEYANYLASHDKMTGLPNYTYFLSYCEEYVKEHADREYALVFSDFRNFHYLNEVYGYMAGDQILQEFSKVLSKGNGIISARVMADRFITLYETDDLEELKEKFSLYGNRFCSEINAKYEQCRLVTVAGIAKVDRSLENFTINVDNSNVARKIAKEDNLSPIIIYNSELRKKLVQHMEIISNMTEALNRKEFKLYLQPKMDIETGKMIGAEALARWRKEDGTILSPDTFIPIFEKNGFITQMDFEILRQVLELQKNLQDSGKKIPVVSVNFSRRHQENSEYINKIDRLLQQYRVSTNNLEIEITESVFMYDLTPLSEGIRELKKRGISVSIDDFGAGYSSLNVLARVDVDVVKLDRQFLLDLEAEKGNFNLEFMQQMIHMIKHLGFKVIAEGVETKEQVELLRKAGCQYVQGYFYAKPMPVNEFLEFAQKYF